MHVEDIVEEDDRFEQVYDAVGDMDFHFLCQTEPYRFEVEKTGYQKTLEFQNVPYHMEEFKEFVSELAEKVPEKMDYECTACGDIWTVPTGAGKPSECDCQNNRFELVTDFPDLYDVVGDMRISVSMKDSEQPIMQVISPKGKKHVFTDVLSQIGLLEEKIERLPEPSRNTSSEVDSENIKHVRGVVKELAIDPVEISAIYSASDLSQEKTDDVINSLKRQGELFEPEDGKIQPL